MFNTSCIYVTTYKALLLYTINGPIFIVSCYNIIHLLYNTSSSMSVASSLLHDIMCLNKFKSNSGNFFTLKHTHLLNINKISTQSIW